MRKIIDLIKQKWLKDTSHTIILIALIIFAYLLVNAGAVLLKAKTLDFTANKLYTLTEDSKKQIENVQQNVDIYFWGFEESDAKVSLAKQYTDINDKIQVQVVSYMNRPDLAATYGVSSTTERLVIVASNQRNKLINANDMVTYDLSTYEQIDITEQKLTNAILDVTIVKKPQIYFLTGHNEFSINSSGQLNTLATYIQNEVNDVNPLNLTVSEMPNPCDLLIIANPTKDFSAEETVKIKNYINKGGDIMWLQDPDVVNDCNLHSFTNINSILSLYAVSLSSGIVCETGGSYTASTGSDSSGSAASTNTNLIIPRLSYNGIVKDLYTDGQIIMLNAGSINVDTNALSAQNVNANIFVRSSDTSYYTENVNSLSTVTDNMGSFNIGELFEKKIDENTASSMVMYASARFATDYAVTNAGDTFIGLGNNLDLLLNTVAFLTDRGETVRIRKTTENVFITEATNTQARIVVTVIFSIPLIIVLIGCIVPLIRRRRK